MYVPDMLEFMAQLAQMGLLGPLVSIAEIGAQEVFASDHEQVLSRFAAALAPGITLAPETLRELSNGPARHLYRAVGLNYSCFDTAPDPDHVFQRKLLDLNFDPLPQEERGRYDLVTSLGVNQHILNQANAFRVAHQLAKPGGRMLHYLPLAGRFDDLYLYYPPRFYEALVQANGYRCLGTWGFVPGNHLAPRSIFPWRQELASALEFPLTPGNQYYVLAVLLAKGEEAPFRDPVVEPAAPPLSPGQESLLPALWAAGGGGPALLAGPGAERLAAELATGDAGAASGARAGELVGTWPGCPGQPKRAGGQVETVAAAAELLALATGTQDADNTGRYSLVVNLGLTAGDLDQLGLFQALHQLTAPGGVMLNLVPVMGLDSPCLFHYDLSFFGELAWTNGYQELGSWFWLPQGLVPVSQGLWERLKWPLASSEGALWTGVALRRRHPLPFQVPYQAFYRRYRDPLLGQRYRLAREQGLLSDDLDLQPASQELREAEIARRRDVVKKRSQPDSSPIQTALMLRRGANRQHARPKHQGQTTAN